MTLQQTERVTGEARHLPSHVLIIDDSPSDRRLLRESLVELGVDPARIRLAATLLEARTALTEAPADCILLDLSLPDASGLEGVAVLAIAAPETPIVVVTGSPVADSLVYAALAEGAEEFVTKADLGGGRLGRALFRAVERRRGTTRAERGARVTGRVLDAIECPTAAIDGCGVIIRANQAWAQAALDGGATSATTGAGVNYLSACDHAVGPGAEGASEAAAGIRALLRGDIKRFSMEYPCHVPSGDRWVNLRVTPLGEAGGGAVVTHLDITPLKVAELELAGAELRLHPVYDEASPIFAVVEPSGIVRHLSHATRLLLGFEPENVSGSDMLERIDPPDAERALAVFRRISRTLGSKERIELTVVDGDGRRRLLDLVVANLADDQWVGAVAISGSDVTSSRRAQIARRLESRLLERLPTAVIVTDDRGIVVYWNARATTLYGYDAAEAVGRPITALNVGPAGSEQAQRIMEETTASGHWEGDYDARHADGSTVAILATLERVTDDEIGFDGLVGCSIDVSERRKLQEDLEFQAYHDPLTGLPNRRLFVEHLDGAVARSARRDGLTAVLFLDMDDFKSINDEAGHIVGDEVLRAVGALITAVAREGDVVARLGGDEFVVCCEDVSDVAEAYTIAGRMLEVLRSPVRSNGRLHSVTASIGVAVSGSTTRGEALLRNADVAMYSAKEAGKGRVELFDDALHERARQRHETALELASGIAAGDFVTWFQPEVDLATGAIFGFEALVRWQHPERGLLSPDLFIGIAEETGLIASLGEQVLCDSLLALRTWLDASPLAPLTMSVNISARQLGDPHLPSVLREALAASGVPPELVCLEVTESALMDAPTGTQVLWELRETGVKIAIDDFGTGYSSLSRLKGFPVDFLKIDRSFVDGLGTDAEDDVIVTAVLQLGHSLGLRLIAEGIKEEHQLARLRELGCELGQGYLWSRPLPFDEATTFLERHTPHRPPPTP